MALPTQTRGPGGNGLGAKSWRTLIQAAVVAGAFALVVCGGMVYWHIRVKAEDPLKSPQLLALKEKLLVTPKDDSVQRQIRALDLDLRRQYFYQLSLNRAGGWLLLGAFLLFLGASKQALRRRETLPMPAPKSEPDEEFVRVRAWARWSVAGTGVIVATGLAWLGLVTTTPLPASSAALIQLRAAPAPANGSPDFASASEARENWPRFRGPDGNGVCSSTNQGLSLERTTDLSMAWSSEVPVAGFNSPIVWGERVFLSGGDKEKREILCYGLQKGEVLWRRAVPSQAGLAGKNLEVPEQTGYAASTMATDGRRVYAIFANGDLAGFDLEGRQLWAKNIGVPKNPHGHASSLITWQGRLIVQVDQGDAEQGLSKLYALDGATGRVIWQRNRPVSLSWATPIVIEVAGQAQIVTLAAPWAIAYAAPDGTELWRTEGFNNEVTPSPVFAGGLVLAISPSEKLFAIHPDGHGDVTKSKLAWAVEDGFPDISSPVSNGELVFAVSTGGLLSCYDLKDGTKVWDHDLDTECHASPTVVGNRLVILATKGTLLVAESGRAFKEVARTELNEKVYASPAFARGKMLIRGVKHLICVAAAPGLARTN